MTSSVAFSSCCESCASVSQTTTWGMWTKRSPHPWLRSCEKVFPMAVGWNICCPQARGLSGRGMTCQSSSTPSRAWRALARTGSVMSWGQYHSGLRKIVRCVRCQTCRRPWRRRCRATLGRLGAVVTLPPVRFLPPQASGVLSLHRLPGKLACQRLPQRCLPPQRVRGRSPAWPPQGRGSPREHLPQPEGAQSRRHQLLVGHRHRQHGHRRRRRRRRRPSSALPWAPPCGSRKLSACRQPRARRPPARRGQRRRAASAPRPVGLGRRSCRARAWAGAPRHATVERARERR
mmetsp:Transcript_124975/g.314615  ORF Transcript_124975/g.314615 Transcript_124975/m.314615 type:complete len:290 (+) Transcript_124975:1543-2412(+)